MSEESIFKELIEKYPKFLENSFSEVIEYAEPRLRKKGITKVAMFDMVTLQDGDKDGLTLWVIPESIIYGHSSDTEGKLMELGVEGDNVDRYSPVRFASAGIEYTGNYLFNYYHNKNLIVSRFDLFKDKVIFTKALRSINSEWKHVDISKIEINKVIKIIMDNLNNEKSRILRDISSYDADITSYQNRIKDAILSINNKLRFIESFEKNKIDEEYLTTKINELYKIPIVKNVRFESGKIIISFPTTYINTKLPVDGESKNVKVKIGDLEFHLDIANHNIYVHNLTEPRINKPHPHASRDNIPCFGDSQKIVIQKLITFDLVNLVKDLYSWSISYNSESPYENILSWYNLQRGVDKSAILDNYPPDLEDDDDDGMFDDDDQENEG